MYQPQPPYPSSKGFTSPPPEAYRASPGQLPAGPHGHGHLQAFSPPPSNGFSPMSSGHSQRYQQYASPSSHASGGGYARQHRYPGGSNGYPAGGTAGGISHAPQQAPPQGAGAHRPYKGILAPGTVVQVGDHQVRVEKYLSEGGYAHVYLTRSERPVYPPARGDKKGRWGERGFTEHCLKRIAFEDDSVWIDVKKEIEVMKALPPNPHLVQYLGSIHNRTSKGHEVFILMEFCAGGGIIDLLNKRLRDRLKEAEILNIFTDVCEAVAAMHALKQPLLHRDLKIENVLSNPTGTPPSPSQPMGLTFKLCDFGSTTFPSSHPPSSKVEADAQAMDLNRHTTLQYRSPEMVEPMLGLAVGLPSDVWALGVLLYKLCYYTTPFEEHGTLAIVNAKYSFPQYPVYSPRIQHLIASMLVEQPIRRPTVFDILRVAHEMSGTRPEVDYPASFSKQIQPPSKSSQSSAGSRPASSSTNLLDFSSPPAQSPVSPPPMSSSFASNIQPQRRGRPTRESSSNKLPPMPQPPSVSSPAPTPAAKIQVTGERERPRSSAKSSVDAFGMPSMPKGQGSGSSGFTDSFTAKPFRPTSRFGRGLSQQQSGLGDSFENTVSGTGGSARSPPVTVQAATPTSIDKISPAQLEIPQTASPTTTASRSATDDQNGNFESRYPSIEALSSGDTASIPQHTLVSPITSPPPNVSRPSMLGNMTGGDIKQPTQHLGIGAEPQPRSTHVTGTAFKQDQGTQRLTRSPSPIKAKKEYFEAMSTSSKPRSPGPANVNEPSRAAVDLMTGDENESMGSPLIAKSPHEPSSTGRSGRSAIPPEALVDSSDDEAGPESATAAHRTYSPIKDGPSPDLAAAPHSPQTTMSDRRSAFERLPSPDKGTSLQPPAGDLSSTSRRDQSRSPQARPKSMYSVPSPTSPPVSAGSSAATGAGENTSQPQGRPGHTRKGSINDIVTRFEGLKPSPSPSTAPPAKPAKPAQLKKPTLDTVRTDPSAGQLQSPILPNSAGATGSGKVSIPPKPEKPLGLARPKEPTSDSGREGRPTQGRFGETPRPDGYSRSSSGRSFPIVKPKPTMTADTAKATLLADGSGGADDKVSTPTSTQWTGDKPGSPEKQQSVNALVARWNQGEVGRKPAPAVKPKPVL